MPNATKSLFYRSFVVILPFENHVYSPHYNYYVTCKKYNLVSMAYVGVVSKVLKRLSLLITGYRVSENSDIGKCYPEGS